MKICNECGAYHEDRTGFDCPKCGSKESLECLITCADCGGYVEATNAIMVRRVKKKFYCPECVEERTAWINALYESNRGLFVQLVRQA